MGSGSTMSDDERFADWRKWVEVIYQETKDLGRNRQMFKMVRDVTECNERLKQTGGHVLSWMFDNYVVAAAMSFRRELAGKHYRNLRQLLHQIEDRPHIINRRRYRDFWIAGGSPHDLSVADMMFDRFEPVHYSRDPERDHIDGAIVKRDREALVKATERVRHFVEQRYAHRTEVRQAPITFGEFHTALDAMLPPFKKYYALLTQVSVDAEPPPYSSRDCFTFAWCQQ